MAVYPKPSSLINLTFILCWREIKGPSLLYQPDPRLTNIIHQSCQEAKLSPSLPLLPPVLYVFFFCIFDIAVRYYFCVLHRGRENNTVLVLCICFTWGRIDIKLFELHWIWNTNTTKEWRTKMPFKVHEAFARPLSLVLMPSLVEVRHTRVSLCPLPELYIV